MSTRRKRVTAADVAEAAGLSRATVGYVLNDTPGQSIPDATRQRVLDAAARLGYRPNRAARMLVSGRSRILLLILPDWPIQHSMQAHLEEASLALDEAGYSLVTTTLHASGRAQPLWETLNPDVVMGLSGLTAEQRAAITATGARVGPEITPGSSRLGFALGPQHQVEHLVARGRQRLVYAGTAEPRLQDLNLQREEQAKATARHLGVEFSVESISEAAVAESVARWLQSGVDAVVAYNDDIAALVAGAALRAGVKIPEDLAIVGHDDTPLARLFVPALSSVRVDYAGLGRYIAALMLSVAGDEPIPGPGPEFDAVVVQREST